jgi:uncharacterized membrane protein YccC
LISSTYTFPLVLTAVATNRFSELLNPRAEIVLLATGTVAATLIGCVFIWVRKPTPPTHRVLAAVSATEVGCPPTAIVAVAVPEFKFT